jgi:hypothetical protein
MPAKLTSSACPACDAPLTGPEVREGWCDSCGKRLPSAPFPARRGEPEATERGAVTLAVFVALMLGFAAVAALTGSLFAGALVLKVGVAVAVAVQTIRAYQARKRGLED